MIAFGYRYPGFGIGPGRQRFRNGSAVMDDGHGKREGKIESKAKAKSASRVGDPFYDHLVKHGMANPEDDADDDDDG